MLKQGAKIDPNPKVAHYNSQISNTGKDEGGIDPYTDPLFLAVLSGNVEAVDGLARRGRKFKNMNVAHLMLLLYTAREVKDTARRAQLLNQIYPLLDRKNAIEIALYLRSDLDSQSPKLQGGSELWGPVAEYLETRLPKKEVVKYVLKGASDRLNETLRTATNIAADLKGRATAAATTHSKKTSSAVAGFGEKAKSLFNKGWDALLKK